MFGKPRCLGFVAFFGAIGLVFAGCGDGGPRLASVSGTVRLGSEPLHGASVVFEPNPGSPSFGFTDTDGRYSLRYTLSKDGAMVGTHTVRISTAEDEEGRRSVERVPARYNVRSELRQEVRPGHNRIDFDLDPQGEVVQPRE
jgi:hypothetical protein